MFKAVENHHKSDWRGHLIYATILRGQSANSKHGHCANTGPMLDQPLPPITRLAQYITSRKTRQFDGFVSMRIAEFIHIYESIVFEFST